MVLTRAVVLLAAVLVMGAAPQNPLVRARELYNQQQCRRDGKGFFKEVDFVSIGTNDLVQYLMAVDRGNDLVSELYQEFSPAVINTLKHIIDETKKSRKQVSLCGEMAADTLAMPLLIGLGLDSLSMSPSTIPYAKRIIRNCDYRKAKRLVAQCLKMQSEEGVKAAIEDFFKKIDKITRTRQII